MNEAPKPINIRPVTGGLEAPCPRPVKRPDGAVDMDRALSLWARDRASLVTCYHRHDDYVDAVAERDRKLSGATKSSK